MERRSVGAERVLVTGGTGFLGGYVVPCLVQRYQSVTCMVRATSNTSQLRALGVELRVADLADASAVRQAFQGIDTLVNLASLGFGHAPTIVRAAVEAGVRRAVFISTTSIFTSLPARTRAVRLRAEESVRQSSLACTVLRPTMIYGSARDRNVARLIRYLARYPVLLVPGSGRALQQPVFVDDVALAVLAALERSQSIGRSYNLAGPRPLSFNQLVDVSASALNRKVARVHLPLGPVVFAASLAAALRLRPGISPEQVLRLGEDKAFDIRAAREGLGFEPIAFEQGVRREIEAMFGTGRTALPPGLT